MARIEKTFCRLCSGHCSLAVTIEDGRVIAVAPDKDAPRRQGPPCVKGIALPEILNHPERLTFPLKRKGNKGERNWERISWDEALDTISEKLENLRRSVSPECVGIALGNPKGLEINFAQRFASAFGTPNIAHTGYICHMPGEAASNFTMGSPCIPDVEHRPRCIVLWGCNPSHSHSITPDELKPVLEAGAKLIVIDPRKTKLAKQADIWIKPRPGSDGVLALGMIKVIIDEHLYDDAFVSQWTVGFDQLSEHIKTYSLQEVEAITWVPTEQIREAARLYGKTKPAAIEWGNALDHTALSFQTCRAISILRVLCGNLDIPGGERLVTLPPLTRPGHFMLLRQFPRNSTSMIGSEFKLATRYMFAPAQSLIKAIVDAKPRPLKAALLFGTNPLITYPNANEVHQALTKLEFLVVTDLFMTPAAAMADIVLPAATVCEFDEVGSYPPQNGVILAYPKLVEPPGECWPDIKIINRLAKKLGMGEYFWDNENAALDLILKPSGLNFDDFKKRRYLQGSQAEKKYEESGFKTPSGKAEIYSSQLAEMGYEPLPLYQELSNIPEMSDTYPLLLTNAKEQPFMHSAHRVIGSLRRIMPEPVITLHPEVAMQLGLNENEWVSIETRMGRITQKLVLDADIDPRIAVGSFGWWYPEKGAANLFGWRESNINILTDNNPPYDPAIGSMDLRGIPCKVSRI